MPPQIFGALPALPQQELNHLYWCWFPNRIVLRFVLLNESGYQLGKRFFFRGWVLNLIETEKLPCEIVQLRTTAS